MMDRKEILEQLNKIYIDTLDNKELIIKENTKATDIDEWDSLTHILLVVEIEKQYDISFKSDEIQNWKDVSEIMDSIGNRINNS